MPMNGTIVPGKTTSTTATAATERRLRFGLVAEQYDRARPGYPPGLIDTVFQYGRLSPGDRALDVGAGTGQVSIQLAERGLNVLALDPSAEMAEIADRKFTRAGVDAQAIVGDFESVELDARAFSLVCAATSWHWLDPATRFEVAARAIAPGGTLAVLWTWPQWRCTALRADLDGIYERSGAPLREMGPMYSRPDAGDAVALAREWVQETRDSGVFGEPQGPLWSWSVTYTSAGYTELLGTYGDHIGLEADVRERLFNGIEQLLDDAGGTIELSYCTLLLLARAR